MMVRTKPVGVHLVGSAPVADAEEMFRLSMKHLGSYLKRLPDGEVGERDTWIRWQFARINASEQMEQTEQENIYVPSPPMKVADGVTTSDEIEFPDLGYANAAIESYAVFKQLRDEGIIPEDIRFMVGLPTPLSVAIFYVEPGSREMFETAYARAIENEFKKMLEEIPAELLSIQWETVAEFGLLEGLMENHLEGNLLENITDRLAALVDLVPDPVEAGIHLCYGDSGHKHFCEPKDAGYLVQVANGVAGKAEREIAWIHMPVPRDRDDAEYFAPLADLDLPEATELYLGLVHQTGGEEGTLRRIKAASTAVDKFGVATECGLGRRDRESIPALMDQHANVASSADA
jgi:methionine synthase II (cobalamin-independent)